MDLTSTIEADSSQINADELPAPRTITITGVNKGTADQPVNIDVAEFPGKAYRPCKSMRRVLVAAWGSDATQYIGRKLTIYNDPTVKWGGAAIGGVRISHMSHIDKPLTLALTETRGKRTPYRVEPLKEQAPPPAPKPPTPDKIIAAFKDLGVTVEQLELRVGADHEKWTAEHIDKLTGIGQAIKAGTSSTYEEFETGETKAVEAEQGTLG